MLKIKGFNSIIHVIMSDITSPLLSGCHALSSHSTPLVSLPLHHLLTVHVHKHLSNDPTRSKESEDLLKVSYPHVLVVKLLDFHIYCNE